MVLLLLILKKSVHIVQTFIPIFTNFCMDTALSFFQSLKNIRPLSNDDKIICDSDISTDEISESIEALNYNKSPCTDGLTDKFYKSFIDDFAPFLFKTYLESIASETLPPTLSQGLLTLIPKPKKDILLIDNWRPICL